MQYRTSATTVPTLVLAVAISLVAFELTPQTVRPAFAQATASSAFEQLPGPSGHVTRLFTPASGALYAQGTGPLYRSDDGGASWQTIPLATNAPNTSPTVAVDPTNHDTLYVGSPDGLSKSIDGGATWTIVLPRDATYSSVAAIAVSPADPSIVYAALRSEGGRMIRFVRSRDGGASWETTEEDGHEHLACQWSISVFQAHPTDPNRLYRAVECVHSGTTTANLQESRDQGMTWSVLVNNGSVSPELVKDPRTTPNPGPTPAPVGRIDTPPGTRVVGSPDNLAGGTATSPSHLTLAINKDYRGGGSSLLQSEDDGRTWRVLFDATGGGTATGPTDTRVNVTIGGIAEDPARPTRLYVAVREQAKGAPPTVTVRVTEDAGATWTDLATLPVGQVYDLGLGIDGANLYVATDQGVWRLQVNGT